VEYHIHPLLQKGFVDDLENQWAATAAAAVALYSCHAPTAIILIKALPSVYADRSLNDIIDHLVSQQLPHEYYEISNRRKESLTYANFLDCYPLLDLFDSDRNLYWSIEKIVEGFGAKRFTRQFTKAQIADVTNKLKMVIDARLPNARYIKH